MKLELLPLLPVDAALALRSGDGASRCIGRLLVGDLLAIPCRMLLKLVAKEIHRNVHKQE